MIAGRLALGNAIVTRAGPALTVAKIEWKQGARSVYNFEVEEDHTYFVGSANGGLWVHNVGPCDVIDPHTVNFSQSSIKGSFSNGGSVDELAQGLKNGSVDPSSIPPIRLLEKDGQLFTLDNRRLETFRRAGVDIPYKMATSQEIASQGWKFTTRNGGKSIRVR